MCYTCVRECPAKAIRITSGQAEVIRDRCIGCGNCVRVCSQRAKKAINSIAEVKKLLASGQDVAACIAPSFAADFQEIGEKQFVGMVRSLGFKYVTEVAFGADLVARRTRELLAEPGDRSYLSTPCPAIFGYVKRYHPELIDSLAPVVSPMIAMSRVMHELYGPELKVVFIGPCIAKKGEAYSDEVSGEIEEVLTFEELHHMFEDNLITRGATMESMEPGDFDPPRAHLGNLFPIGRGLLEAAKIHEDLVTGEVISANGKSNFIDAIIEFSSGETNAKLLDILCCDGCIMGPGMVTTAPLFRRRALVSNYVRKTMMSREKDEWLYYMEKFRNIDLSRSFSPYDQRIAGPDEETIQNILKRMGKLTLDDELNCGACGYDTCRKHAIAIHQGFAESEMCLPYMIEQLHTTIDELAISSEQLENTREALVQSEKLASMGQLAAGIAHEINNPLGVVLMYAHLLLDELRERSENQDDLRMIVDHADRAKKIVAGLLNFARQTKVNLKSLNVLLLMEECIKAIQMPENVNVEIVNDLTDPVMELDRDQIFQVLTNLISNSLNAMVNGGTLKLIASGDENNVRLIVKDTGSGIPKEVRSKVFEPFFTTKKAGEGTGLGLAIIYGIVKMHRGDITLESNDDVLIGPTGTTFTVTLPRRGKS